MESLILVSAVQRVSIVLVLRKYGHLFQILSNTSWWICILSLVRLGVSLLDVMAYVFFQQIP